MKNKTKKILILGGTGSGKTILGGEISKITGFPHTSLDWVVYEDNWESKRSKLQRDKHIKELLRAGKWVLEGAYTEGWLKSIIKKADFIIILKIPRPIISKRVLSRYVKSKTEGSKKKVDTFKHMLILLKFACSYKSKDFHKHKKMVEEEKKDYKIFTSKKQIKKFLESLI